MLPGVNGDCDYHYHNMNTTHGAKMHYTDAYYAVR